MRTSSAQQAGESWGQIAVPAIDWLFEHIGDTDHCRRVAASESAKDLHPPHWAKLLAVAGAVGLLTMAIRAKKL